MQRLFNIGKWTVLRDGQSLRFESDRPRVVKLDVNSRSDVGLYLMDAVTGGTVFVARVCGRDSVEFHVGGSFTLVSDGECSVYTADGQSIHHEVVDPVIFTRMSERRQIAPEVRKIQELMNLNMERRLARQRVEFEAILKRLDASSGVGPRYRDRAIVAARASAAEPVSAAESESGDGGDPPAPDPVPARKAKK